MFLLSKSYWGGAPNNFRAYPEDAHLESLILKAADRREHKALYWAPKKHPNPKVGVVIMHPRGEFGHHFVIPRLLDTGVCCMGAQTRNPNNDTTTIHEQIILDVNSCVNFLKNVKGVEKVVLVGNSGGGALNGFFQSQAKKPKGKRIATTPGGRPTRLEDMDMIPADGLIYIATHKGEGMIMNEIIDPSVVDESNPLLTNPDLDMYDERNGFKPPGEWCEYDDDFIKQYRAAQLDRVRRIDNIALAMIHENDRAEALHKDPDFGKLSLDRQRDILRREAFEPVITIYRTMANLHYVDRHLDPSNRDYGSVFSPRPDLMNFQFFGFGRYATPHAWLSTWSGLQSKANQLKCLPEITEPSLFLNAGKDQEIYPETDAKAMFEASGSEDKSFVDFLDAKHYFEPEFGEKEAPDVELLMDKVTAWIEERFET